MLYFMSKFGHIKKHSKNSNSFGLKLIFVFLFGVFVGAIGVVIALKLLTVSVPVKTTGSLSPGYPPSFSNYPPGPPPSSSSPSGK